MTTTEDLPASSLPTRAQRLELLGPMDNSGYRQAPGLVRRADGQTIQLTPLLYRVLEQLDGTRDLAEVAAATEVVTGRQLTVDDVKYLVETKLAPLDLMETAGGPATSGPPSLLGLRGRLVFAQPATTARLAEPFVWLFRPPIVAAVCIAFAAVSAWVMFGVGLAAPMEKALFDPKLILLLIGLTVVSAAFHELGHAAASRYGGAAPGRMGAALYLVWPVFYTDVTGSYSLDRRARLRVDLGGLYFNAVFALVVIGIATLAGSEALLVMLPIQLLQMLRQLIPVVRFDGYHILADLIGVPDLFARIGPVVRSVLPGQGKRPEVLELKPWARAVVIGWVALVVPALVIGFGLAVWNLPRIGQGAWSSLTVQAGVLRRSADQGAFHLVALGVVSMVAVALLPMSLTYLVARVGRRAATRAWSLTDGRPASRAVALAATTALLAGTASAWWPGSAPGGPLPVAAQPAAAAPHHQPVAAAPTSGSDRAFVVALTDGGQVLASVTRTVEHQAVSITGRERSGWPFPFDPPPAARPGDNLAYAVNLSDGSTVFVSAFALEWLFGGPVLNANRAYAVASCVDCTTTAVAFQVLIAEGNPSVVVPENSAVAANYECTSCATTALGVQLVVTVTKPLDEAAKAEIETLWDRAEALEAAAPTMPTEEVYAELVAIRSGMLEVLEPYVEPEPDRSTGTGAQAPVPPPTDSDSAGAGREAVARASADRPDAAAIIAAANAEAERDRAEAIGGGPGTAGEEPANEGTTSTDSERPGDQSEQDTQAGSAGAAAEAQSQPVPAPAPAPAPSTADEPVAASPVA